MIDNETDFVSEVKSLKHLEPLEYGVELGRVDAREVGGGVLVDVDYNRLGGDRRVGRGLFRETL